MRYYSQRCTNAESEYAVTDTFHIAPIPQGRIPGWVGFDLDATLAHYDGWKGADHVGAPVPAMIELIKNMRAAGDEVRIFTARVWPILTVITPDWQIPTELHWVEARVVNSLISIRAIRGWCLEHIGEVLPITCVKDYAMIALYDDRAIQVEANTGRVIGKTEV